MTRFSLYHRAAQAPSRAAGPSAETAGSLGRRLVRIGTLGLAGLLVSGAAFSGASVAVAVGLNSVEPAEVSAVGDTGEPAGDGAAAPVDQAPRVADQAPQEATNTATLEWGVRESFRNYITGPIAKGAITPLGHTQGSSRFTWTGGIGTGTAQPDGTGLEIAFGDADGVHFQGHAHGADFILDLTVTHPRITVTSATTAELFLDVVGREFIDTSTVGTMVATPNVHFAHLELPAPTRSGHMVTWSNADAVMTAEGLQAFGGFYNAASAGLDPVTFSAEVADAPTTPVPTATSTAVTAQPVSPYVGTAVNLSATVQPAEAAGAVQFTTNGTPTGDPATLQNGAATASVTPGSAGTYTYGAVFIPDDPTAFRGSRGVAPNVVIEEQVTGTAGTLQWGVKQSFRNYVVGPIAGGKIAASDGAKQAAGNGVFTFPQASTKNWNGSTGSVRYAGKVNFSGHHGQMDVDLLNPEIVVRSASAAELRVPFAGKTITLAEIDLTAATREGLRGDAVKFSKAQARLSKAGAEQFFVNDTGEGPPGQFYSAGTVLDEMTFIIGADSGTAPAVPTDPSTKPKPQPKPPSPAPTAPVATGGAAAGSLSWSVSNAFIAYTTCANKEQFGYAHCAKGSIDTNGVGAGYLFPQAASSNWDRASQTGTVNYSGSVAFKGYGMTMYNVSNPSITVTGPSSATLSTGNTTSFGSASYELDLASGTKSVGSHGEVTWSNVPVRGSLSSGGAGGSGNQSIGLDPLTFTVGSESQVSYGATQNGADAKKYTPAATAPATTGVTVLTDPDKITPGGRIEIEAAGFDTNDAGVLVVIYSEPIVLDDAVSADTNGVVRWSGTLPEKLTGTHTITVQGSTNAGAVIDIVDAKKKSAQTARAEAEQLRDGVAADRVTTAGFLPGAGGMALWEWWASAGGLAAVAACMTLLAIRQRRASA